MSKSLYPTNQYAHYHAHLYYDQGSYQIAQAILDSVEFQMKFKVGRRHQKCVGPHPNWSCQISFTSDTFEKLIPWLDENRAGLSILVHPVTGDDLKDHTLLASWLGEPVPLKLAMFQST